MANEQETTDRYRRLVAIGEENRRTFWPHLAGKGFARALDQTREDRPTLAHYLAENASPRASTATVTFTKQRGEADGEPVWWVASEGFTMEGPYRV